MAKSFSKPFYDSRLWKNTRKQILRDAGYTCQECNANRASEVHHKIPLTPENINDISISLHPDNLEAVCGECHKKITKGVGDVVEGYAFDEEGNVVRGQ